jgi:hypothetical protein
MNPSTNNERCTKVSLKDWVQFSSELMLESEQKKASPQFSLFFKTLSTAEGLANNYPNIVNNLLTKPPELLEFSDGAGAVRFLIKDKNNIRKVFELVLDGDYPDRLVIKGALFGDLPDTEITYFASVFGAGGAKGMAFGNVCLW